MQGWESVLVGGLWFLGKPKDSNGWFATNTKSPRQSTISQRLSALFQTYFWFSRIYLCFKNLYDFHIFQRLSSFHHRKILRKRSEKPIVLDPPDFGKNTNWNWVSHVWCPAVSIVLEIVDFQHDEIWTIFLKDASIISYSFWSILVINEGCKGPDLVNILEVSKITQKVLEPIRNH